MVGDASVTPPSPPPFRLFDGASAPALSRLRVCPFTGGGGAAWSCQGRRRVWVAAFAPAVPAVRRDGGASPAARAVAAVDIATGGAHAGAVAVPRRGCS